MQDINMSFLVQNLTNAIANQFLITDADMIKNINAVVRERMFSNPIFSKNINYKNVFDFVCDLENWIVDCTEEVLHRIV